MASRSPKPVKQCDGCIFNDGDKCKVYHFPIKQWADGPCPGYDNYEMAHELGIANDGQGAHLKRNIRKNKAKYQNTIEREETHNFMKKIKWP